jgi:hypothetical protein
MRELTFGNPGGWPWLLALGIPLLLHLLSRRTLRPLPLPTFAFVRQAQARQSRLFRLRRPLLLLLRLLTVLSLVLTFLQPTRRAPFAVAENQRRARILLLDVSLSMGYTSGGVASLARAKAQAARLLDELRGGDLANVILAGSAPFTVLPRPGRDLGTLMQAVRAAQTTSQQGQMAAALALAAEQLAGVKATQKELLILSDFQRSNWRDVRFDAFPPEVRLVFFPVETAPRENAAVTALRLQPAAPRPGEPTQLFATLWNGSPVSRALRVHCQWAVANGQSLQNSAASEQRTLTLPPYTSGDVAFPIVFPEPNRYQIAVRLPPDALPADDTRYLIADLRRSQTVLLLTDADTRRATGAFFLRQALNPTPEMPGGVRVITKRPSDLTETDLRVCDAVLLTDVVSLPGHRAALLMEYTRAGGAVIAFLRGESVPRQMEGMAKLLRAGETLPFLPRVPMDMQGHEKGYLSLTEARSDSPLLAWRRGLGLGDLERIRFRRFFLTSPPAPEVETLLRFEDGTPAAALSRLGDGRLLFCNFSPDPADSDLAQHPLFPPLLHEFLKGLATGERRHNEFTPGQSAATALESVSGAITAQAPDGATIPVTIDRHSGSAILESVEKPGIYTLRSDGVVVAALAVNSPAGESDLRPLDTRALETVSAGARHYLVGTDGRPMATQWARLQQPLPLWPYCLLSAFVCLLLEQAVLISGGRLRRAEERHFVSPFG